MPLYVQIQNNEVKQCWDTPPPDGVGNNGWKNAVEIRPAIIPYRQDYTAHIFDLTKDPVEIIYNSFDISVADRKIGMKSNAETGYQQEMQNQMMDPMTYDPVKLQAAKDSIAPKVAAIEAATTHDELDALM